MLEMLRLRSSFGGNYLALVPPCAQICKTNRVETSIILHAAKSYCSCTVLDMDIQLGYST